MAIKPLKSIKFPGLSDTYTIPQVDSTLTQSGQAADAKAVGDELTNVKTDLREIEPGLSDDAKMALLNCFQHVAWIDEHGQDYYDALEESLYAVNELISIAATFTQGSAIIYNTDSLESLKQYLIVIANYSNGTSDQINRYTLSGTLTVGTSAITVSYGGKSDTFNVTVSPSATPPIYELSSERSFNGTSDYIDTGIQLAKVNSPFTIVYDILDQLPSSAAQYSQTTLYHCMNENAPYPGYSHVIQRDSEDNKMFGFSFNGVTPNYDNYFTVDEYNTNTRIKVVVTKMANGSISIKYKTIGGNIEEITTVMPEFVSINDTLLLGAAAQNASTLFRFWKGIIYDFKVYDFPFSASEANAYLMRET